MLRISSSQMFTQVSKSLLKHEAEYGRLVEQLSTGRRILSAGDDPLAASHSVNVAGALAQMAALANNRAVAEHELKSQENVLKAVTTTMLSVLERLVYAGNDVLNDTNRRSLATDLKGMRDALIGLANSTDGNGRYIFSGYDSETQAYNTDGVYLVDTNRNKMPKVQISPHRQMEPGVVGSEVFARPNPDSTGYVVSAGSPNTGTAQAGTLISSTTGKAISRTVTFLQVPNGSLEYRYVNNAGNTVINTYVGGQALDLGDGMTLLITGTPENNDTFTVKSFKDFDSVNVFGALDKLIAGLNTVTMGDPKGAAVLWNTLSEGSKILQNAFDNIQTVLLSLGSKMREVAALNDVGITEKLVYTKQLSDLENVEIVTAMSEAAQLQTALQAAGMAFKAIQDLSLFQQ